MDINETLKYIYKEYNRKRVINPDPLLFLYDYPDLKYREIAGFIASRFAFGQVSQIMKMTSIVLSIMGKSPFEYVVTSKADNIIRDFKGFQ